MYCTWRELIQDEVEKDSIWQQAGDLGVGEGPVEGPQGGAYGVEECPGGQRHSPCQAYGLQQLLQAHSVYMYQCVLDQSQLACSPGAPILCPRSFSDDRSIVTLGFI